MNCTGRCKSKKKKKNINKSQGFTLVELLATIALLSLVVTVVIYVATGVIDSAKENSYKVTVNNIQSAASNYTFEDFENFWVDGGYLDDDNQYQCVSVQNLIDTGYFGSDVLNSYVRENRKVNEDDYVYLERDKGTKTVIRNVIDLDNVIDECREYADRRGKIRITSEPLGWSKQKKVKIYYNLYNLKDSSELENATYEYTYLDTSRNVVMEGTGTFDMTSKIVEVDVDINGTMYAKIISNDVSVVPVSYTITTIDTKDPEGRIEASNSINNKQNVYLYMSDPVPGSGLDKYYFGTKSCGSEWFDIPADFVQENGYIGKTVSEPEVYRLCIKDKVGREKVILTKFFKTDLVVENASINPSSILTMSGKTITLPSANANAYYTFNGWYTNSDYSGIKITSYSPTDNSTLYGKVTENKLTGGAVVISGTAKYGETLYANRTQDTTPNADKYSYQWYYSTVNSNGTGIAISGATYSSYKIGSGLVGKYIYVKVTATKENYRSIKFASVPVLVRSASVPIPTCNSSLTYNGTSQLLVKENANLYTLSNNSRTNYGTQTVTVALKDKTNYEWSDGTISNKTLSCSIAKKSLTIKAKNQTKNKGMAISTGVGYVTTSGLVSGDTLTSISLSANPMDVSRNGTITPSNAVIKRNSMTVTSNYNITYQTGNLTVNTYKVTINYKINGGSLVSDASSDGYSTATDLIYKNGNLLRTIVEYDGALTDGGLENVRNSNYSSGYNYKKSGYNVITDKEWICLSGECKDKVYNQWSYYDATDFCDASNGNCTVTLGVNWIDNIPPTLSINNPKENTWTKDPYNITLNASDSGSGIDYYYYMRKQDDGQYKRYDSSYGKTSYVDQWSAERNEAVSFKVCDKAANCTVKTSTVKIDKTAPTLSIKNPYTSSWYNIAQMNAGKEYKLELTATESGSGVKSYGYYTTGNGKWIDYANSTCINGSKKCITGAWTANRNDETVWLRVCDNVGNCREGTTKIKIDVTPPTINCSASTATITETEDSGVVYDLTTTYINSCSVSAILPAKGGKVTPDNMFTVSDNFSLPNGYGLTTKSIINEYGVESNLKQTDCNCDNGFCQWTLTGSVTDAGGNTATRDFIYKVKYEYILTWAPYYCS